MTGAVSRRRRPTSAHHLRDDERGVTIVLGAVMLVGLMITAIVTVQIRFVPHWTEDKEADRLDIAQDDMIDMASALVRMVDNGSAPVSVPVALGVDSDGRWFQAQVRSAELEIVPGTGGAALSADRLLVIQRDGVDLAGIEENWTNITTTSDVSNIGTLQHLRIRVTDPASGAAGDNVALTVIDSSGAFAGSLTVYKEDYPSGYALKTRVVDANGVVRYDDGESRFQQDMPSMFWVNAMSPETLFESVVQAAKKPASFQFTQSGWNGAYTASFIEHSSGTPSGSSGQDVIPFLLETQTGRVIWNANHQQLPDQDLMLEHGAVVAVQDDGAVLLSGPAVDIRKGPSTTLLRIDMPGIASDEVTRSGGGVVTSTLSGQGGTSLRALAPHFIINLTTNYPMAWNTWWNDHLRNSGLDATSGEYVVTTGSGWCKVAIYGSDAAVTSTALDVTATIASTDVAIRFEA